MVKDGYRWLRMVKDGLGWLRMVKKCQVNWFNLIQLIPRKQIL
jgi:hypothetical protein